MDARDSSESGHIRGRVGILRQLIRLRGGQRAEKRGAAQGRRFQAFTGGIINKMRARLFGRQADTRTDGFSVDSGRRHRC